MSWITTDHKADSQKHLRTTKIFYFNQPALGFWGATCLHGRINIELLQI